MPIRFEHLKAIDQTYFQHFKNAFFYSILCQKASLYFAVHAIYPDWFVKNGSQTIQHLQILLSKQIDKERIQQN